jgi:hypothetical protein
VDVGAAADTAPVSSETYLSAMGFPEKNSPAVREGSMEGAGGKMSDWNESDCVGGWYSASVPVPSPVAYRWVNERGRGNKKLTLRGTMNAMGSMEFEEVTLYARAISHSEVLTARRGTKHIPRCGSLDLCSSNA